MNLLSTRPAPPATARPDPPHPGFHPKDWLDRVFAVGIVAKGLNGLGEILGGVLLLLVSPAGLSGWVRGITAGELGEDPHDLVATYLRQAVSGLDGGSLVFGSLYLLVHGLVKVVLVMALLRNKLWAYPWMIAVLLAFVGYQVGRIALTPTVGMVALTAFDLVIVTLTAVEYRRQRRAHRLGSADPVQDGV